MIKVQIKKSSNHAVSVVSVKRALTQLLEKHGIVSDAVVYVAIVNEAKMKALGKKFLGEDGKKAHNVLSFTESEIQGKFVYPPGGFIQLGEIVVCYSIALNEAKKEGKLIDAKVIELVNHGALHLLGIHHN